MPKMILEDDPAEKVRAKEAPLSALVSLRRGSTQLSFPSGRAPGPLGGGASKDRRRDNRD